MLTNSLWHNHRVNPLEHHAMLGDKYLAILPECKRIISLFPVMNTKACISIGSISVRYEEVAEHQVRFALSSFGPPKWQEALYREEEDFLQWFEPRGGESFNMFSTKLAWKHLTGDYLKQLNKEIDRINMRNSSLCSSYRMRTQQNKNQ